MDSILISSIASDLQQIKGRQSVGSLTRILSSQNLIRPMVTMGEGDASGEKLAGLARSSTVSDPAKWKEGIEMGRSNLLRIYQDRKKRVNFAFYFSLFCSVLAVLLLLWIIFRKDRSDVSIKLIMTLVPSFLSATLFWIYRLESRKMEIIEGNMMKLEMLENKLDMLSALDDKDQVVRLLKKLI